VSPPNSHLASLSLEQPYAFVVGCPRSGTTLLLRMLDAHSQFAVANDTHFIPRVLEKQRPWEIASVLAGGDLPLDRELVEAAMTYHRSARLELSPSDWEKAANTSKSYAEFVSRLYEAFAQMRSKTFAIEKTPDYVRHIPLLHALFPQAKFVHIVRDGRDVALSLRDWANKTKGPGKFERWDEDPIAVSALWWEWLVTQGRAAGVGLPANQYLEVSYEALLARPEETLSDLCKFLKVPFERSMGEFHQGKRRDGEGLSAKQAWLPPTPGLRSWRCQMSQSERERFEALVGPSLADFGYETLGGEANPAAHDAAIEFRSWWEDYLRQRSERFASRCQRDDAGSTEAPSYVI
jgi:Sulfotransferase family